MSSLTVVPEWKLWRQDSGWGRQLPLPDPKKGFTAVQVDVSGFTVHLTTLIDIFSSINVTNFKLIAPSNLYHSFCVDWKCIAGTVCSNNPPVVWLWPLQFHTVSDVVTKMWTCKWCLILTTHNSSIMPSYLIPSTMIKGQIWFIDNLCKQSTIHWSLLFWWETLYIFFGCFW